MLRLAPPPGTAAAAEGGGAAVTAAAVGSNCGRQHLLFYTALDLDCPADAVAAGGAPSLELADKPQGSTASSGAGSSAGGAIGSVIQRWMAGDSAGDKTGDGASHKIQLQFQLEELPCDTAAAAALAVVKERVIQGGHQLACGAAEPEAMAGMQREVAALRRGIAELKVGAGRCCWKHCKLGARGRVQLPGGGWGGLQVRETQREESQCMKCAGMRSSGLADRDPPA